MTISLHSGQYEMGGVVFGTRSPYAVPNEFLVGSFDAGQGAISSVDTAYPNEDGTKFGEDFYQGMLLTFQVNLWKKGQPAYDDLAKLKRVWKSREFRKFSNEVTTLRICKGDRVRFVYGRPRRFKEAYGAIERGWAPIDLDFQCSDECFYDDEQKVQEIGMVSAPTAGLVLPTPAPITTYQYAITNTLVTVEGDYPTWPTFIIKGPVVRPSIQYDDQWRIALNLSLDHTQTISIDTRPWRRLTLLNDRLNMSGKYTSESPVMRDMQFHPGPHNIVYTGIDESLSSSVLVGWRPAWSTP